MPLKPKSHHLTLPPTTLQGHPIPIRVKPGPQSGLHDQWPPHPYLTDLFPSRFPLAHSASATQASLQLLPHGPVLTVPSAGMFSLSHPQGETALPSKKRKYSPWGLLWQPYLQLQSAPLSVQIPNSPVGAARLGLDPGSAPYQPYDLGSVI